MSIIVFHFLRCKFFCKLNLMQVDVFATHTAADPDAWQGYNNSYYRKLQVNCIVIASKNKLALKYFDNYQYTILFKITRIIQIC